MRTLSRSFAGTAAATTTRGNEKTHQPFLLLLFCLCNFVFGCSSLSILELHIPTGGKDDESRTAGEPLRDSRLTYSRRALVSVFPFFLLLLLLFVFLKIKKETTFRFLHLFFFISAAGRIRGSLPEKIFRAAAAADSRPKRAAVHKIFHLFRFRNEAATISLVDDSPFNQFMRQRWNVPRCSFSCRVPTSTRWPPLDLSVFLLLGF